jgi:type IV pilus assembly protein PilC
MSRFSSTISTLLSSGLTIEQALRIGAGTAGNSHIQEKVMHARERVVEGATLATSLKQENTFPSMLIQMIGVGEDSGNLGFMLKKASQAFQRDYENLLERFLSLIEPVIILVMGGIVAFIVISVMLPLLNISQIIK